MIKSVEELYENTQYYICTGIDLKGRPCKPTPVRLLGIVQEFERSELYVCNLSSSKRQSYWVTNIFGIHESGIGKTEKEAMDNYGKLHDMKVERAYKSQEAVHEDLKRVEYAPDTFTYYNYRSVGE